MRLAILEELAQEVSRPSSAEQLANVMATVSRRLGFDHFAVAYDQWIGSTSGPSFLINDYPTIWGRIYVDFDLSASDPVRRACGYSFVGFPWREIGRFMPLTLGDKRMFAAGQEVGIADGFTVPRFLPGQASAACSFVVGPRTRMPVDMLVVAEAIGALALATAQRIVGAAAPAPKPLLSDRQRECMLWWARGLTAKMIAAELGISEGTVVQHLRAARERYEVHSSGAAVARAIADGLFCAADIRKNANGGYFPLKR